MGDIDITKVSPVKKFAGLALVAGVLLSAASVPSAAVAAPSDAVAFTDPALEVCVREQLQAEEGDALTEEQLASMKSLSCRNRGITDIEPLAFATSVRFLDLFGNQVSDLSPIADMLALEDLGLANNPVEELAPLAGHPSLKDLYLNNSTVSDLTPLASVPKLRALLLQNNKISDLTPLQNATNLMILYVPGNSIRDLSPLNGLPKLQTVNATRQMLPPVEVTVGSPMESPAVSVSGDRIPLQITGGEGVVEGSAITWTAAGPGSVLWDHTWPLGASKGLYSGRFDVNVAPVPAVALEGTPPSGVVGTPYGFDFVLTGVPTAPTSTIVQGALPDGLALSTDGRIEGTPTKPGTFEFVVLVVNGAAEQTYSRTIVVTEPAIVPPEEGGEDDGETEGGGKGKENDKTGGVTAGSQKLAQSGGEAPGSLIAVSAAALVLGGAAAVLGRRRTAQRHALSGSRRGA